MTAAFREATLMEILDRKEARARRYQELLARENDCILGFTCNTPTSFKDTKLSRACFKEGKQEIELLLSNERILHSEQYFGVTGCEAVYLLKTDPFQLKKRTAKLEQTHPLGRLWDIDIIVPGMKSISRKEIGMESRRCIICENDAKICGRNRTHSPKELFDAFNDKIVSYFRCKAAKEFAGVMYQATLQELLTTPKPGLVDMNNSGSHMDMNARTFHLSADALYPWFEQFVICGCKHAKNDSKAQFFALREIGRQAEKAMFDATDGVNTHKGLIFSAAILCGAFGILSELQQNTDAVKEERLFEKCADLAVHSLEDFGKSDCRTFGLACYLNNGISGIRGEAAAGFPSVSGIALPELNIKRNTGWLLNDACVFALMRLIANVQDTNMVHRGGIALAESSRTDAERICSISDCSEFLSETLKLDRNYIEKNLSPGGCADLLSIALAVYFGEQQNLIN